MPRAIKFDECRECIHYKERNNEVCEECPAGEQFEPVEEDGLNLDVQEVRFG